jgi:hypothetical protein
MNAPTNGDGAKKKSAIGRPCIEIFQVQPQDTDNAKSALNLPEPALSNSHLPSFGLSLNVWAERRGGAR